MKRLYLGYISSFEGLSKEVWWLALITLINRAGTMVIPFLSLYLTENLGFTLAQVGLIMTSFGFGSAIGAWLGGKLTDKFGFYSVMLGSLALTGISFIIIQFFNGFYEICAGIFILMIIADAFRPAMFVALSAYSKPENKIRSVTLIRLAINLGFSVGPALGGLIITMLSYNGLFWMDGITCIIASILLYKILNPKKATITTTEHVENPKSAYKDKRYIVFIFAIFLFAVAFVQYFSAMPIYYREVHHLSEFQIGLLLFINGFIITVFEMPLVKFFESKNWSRINNIVIGIVLISLSFLFLNISSWTGILIVGMLFMTFGEMIAFPFSNAYAMDSAKGGRQGQYMALYSIAFSVSHIFGHNSLQYIEKYGFENTWYAIIGITMISILILLLLNTFIKRKKTS